jgi:hypothetical protein
MYQQSHHFSCWPACLKIIEHKLHTLGYDLDIPTEIELMKECMITDMRWTLPSIMKTVIHNHFDKHPKLTVHYHSNLSYSDLINLHTSHQIIPLHLTLRSQNPHYTVPGPGYWLHYWVIENITSDSITLHNPFGFKETFTTKERIQRRSLSERPISRQTKALITLWIVTPYSALCIHYDTSTN